MPSSEYKKHLLFEDEIIVSKNDGSKKRVFTDPHEAHAYYEDIRTEELQDEAARAQITAVEQNKQILKNQQKLIENQQKGTQMPRFNAPQITHQVLDPQYKEWLQFQQETDPAYLKWKAKKEEDARRIRMENDRKRREYEEKERLHREEQKKKEQQRKEEEKKLVQKRCLELEIKYLKTRRCSKSDKIFMSSNSSNKEIIDILRVSRDLDVLRALSHNENIAASIKTKIVDRIDKLVSSSKKAEEETQKQQEKYALVDSCAMKIILICILAVVVLVTLASLG